MEIPRHSTDMIVGFACAVCNGNGGFGMRMPDTGSGGQRASSPNFSPCGTCNGSGWQAKRPGELSPEQIRKLLAKLPAPPPTLLPTALPGPTTQPPAGA